MSDGAAECGMGDHPPGHGTHFIPACAESGWALMDWDELSGAVWEQQVVFYDHTSLSSTRNTHIHTLPCLALLL